MPTPAVSLGRLLAQAGALPAQRRIPLGRLQHHEAEMKQGDDDDRGDRECTQHANSPCPLL